MESNLDELVSAAESAEHFGKRAYYVNNDPAVNEADAVELDLNFAFQRAQDVLSTVGNHSLREKLCRTVGQTATKEGESATIVAEMMYMLIAGNLFPLHTINEAHLEAWKIQHALSSTKAKFLSFVNDNNGDQRPVFPYVCPEDIRRLGVLPVTLFIQQVMKTELANKPPPAKRSFGGGPPKAPKKAPPKKQQKDRFENKTICSFVQSTHYRGYFMALFPPMQHIDDEDIVRRHTQSHIFFQEVFVAPNEAFIYNLQNTEDQVTKKKFWNVAREFCDKGEQPCVSMICASPKLALKIMDMAKEDAADQCLNYALLPCSQPGQSEHMVSVGKHVAGHFMNYEAVMKTLSRPDDEHVPEEGGKKRKLAADKMPAAIFPFYYPRELREKKVRSHLSTSFVTYMKVQKLKQPYLPLDPSILTFTEQFPILTSTASLDTADTAAEVQDFISQLVTMPVLRQLRQSILKRLHHYGGDRNLSIPMAFFTTVNNKSVLGTIIQTGLWFAAKSTSLKNVFYLSYLTVAHRLHSKFINNPISQPTPVRFSTASIGEGLLNSLFKDTFWGGLAGADRNKIVEAFKFTPKTKISNTMANWCSKLEIEPYMDALDDFSKAVVKSWNGTWKKGPVAAMQLREGVNALRSDVRKKRQLAKHRQPAKRNQPPPKAGPGGKGVKRKRMVQTDPKTPYCGKVQHDETLTDSEDDDAPKKLIGVESDSEDSSDESGDEDSGAGAKTAKKGEAGAPAGSRARDLLDSEDENEIPAPKKHKPAPPKKTAKKKPATLPKYSNDDSEDNSTDEEDAVRDVALNAMLKDMGPAQTAPQQEQAESTANKSEVRKTTSILKVPSKQKETAVAAAAATEDETRETQRNSSIKVKFERASSKNNLWTATTISKTTKKKSANVME